MSFDASIAAGSFTAPPWPVAIYLCLLMSPFVWMLIDKWRGTRRNRRVLRERRSVIEKMMSEN